MAIRYPYSILNDTANGEVSDSLQIEIGDSPILIALNKIEQLGGDDLDIWFEGTLSTSDKQLLDDIVLNHQGVSLLEMEEVKIAWEDSDDSGRPFTRVAITEKGWAFLAHFVECETSVKDSLFCENYQGVSESQHYCKFYDGQGLELTEQSQIDTDCVKSVFTIKPGVDVEMIAGEIHQFERPVTNMRLHSVIGVIAPDGSQIAVREFARNLNMKFKDKAKTIATDGRAPKRLNKVVEGVPYDANQIQIIVNHEPGVKHQFMVELEYYRQ